jgi:K+-transporting ATPase A subunit
MQALIQYGAFLLILTLLVKPLGGYMARVFQGQRRKRLRA